MTGRRAAACVGREVAIAAAVLLALAPARGHEGHHHGDSGSTARLSMRNADGTVTLVADAQTALGFKTMELKETDATATREIPGRVVAAPGGLARIQAPRDGRVGVQELFPAIGQRVEQGAALLTLEPILSAAEESQIRQALIATERELALLMPRAQHVGQVNPLMPMGDATVQLLQELQVQSESLGRQRDTLREILSKPIEVRAPVSGLISSVTIAIGQVASARDTMIEIVADLPPRVEAWDVGTNSDSTDLKTGAIATATAGSRSVQLAFAGRGPALRQQALVLFFDVKDGASLALGTAVRVQLPASAPKRALVVPASAVITNGAGVGTVWLQTTPERFEPRIVSTASAGSDQLIVLAGLQAGARVVVNGAAMLHFAP